MSINYAPAPGSRDTRRNILALGADFALFFVALSFASQSTILPAFAEHLGAPNIVIGAIPAVMGTGWLLPSLFAAGHTETLSQKLPFVLRYTVWERLPFLGLAAVAFFLASTAPAAALAVTLILLIVITAVGGALMPAWMDVIGRTVPVQLRGRFFGVATIIGNTGAVIGSLGTAWILGNIAAPISYGWCFVIATVFMGLSYCGMALTREPPGVSVPAVPLNAYLKRAGGMLRRDRNFTWYLLGRGFSSVGLMASGFYAVYALRVHHAAEWDVGLFTTLLLVGEIVGMLILGWLGDRFGHRLVVIVGVAAALLSSLLALASPSLEIFRLVFAIQGVQVASKHVSDLNILLELAPSVGERPTYVGLGNTVPAPVALCAPLIAGLLVDLVGFGAVFLVAALGGIVSLIVLSLRVRDPRHEGTLATT